MRKAFNLFFVCVFVALLGFAMIGAIEDTSVEHTVSGQVNVVDTGSFKYISVYNAGPEKVTLKLYNQQTLLTEEHPIPSGASWCPPNSCALNSSRQGYQLNSTNATVYVSIQ